MRNILLTLAATGALMLGSLAWTNTAEARPWRYGYRAPVARYYGYRPYYYSYRPYYGYYYGPRYTYPSYYYYPAPYLGGRFYYYY